MRSSMIIKGTNIILEFNVVRNSSMETVPHNGIDRESNAWQMVRAKRVVSERQIHD